MQSHALPCQVSLLDLTYCLVSAVQEDVLFGGEQEPDRLLYQSQYFASMAGLLTQLELCAARDMIPQTCSALGQLHRLRSLKLEPDLQSMNAGDDVPHLQVELQLPGLRKLMVANFHHVAIVLLCPELTHLEMWFLQPLVSLHGMPASIEKVEEYNVHCAGLMSLRQMFPVQPYPSLEELVILQCQDGLGDPAVLQELCLNGKLRVLEVDG